MATELLIEQARQILDSALHSVNPYNLIHEQLSRQDNTLIFPNGLQLDLRKYDRIFIVGAGKGAAPMARAMEDLLGDYLTGGDIIVKYEHLDDLQKVRLHEAGHPVPDENSLRCTDLLLNNISGLTENDCVLVLLTGGGSALLESLPQYISLDDLQQLSKVLLGCSATIHEINCIRKHISRVKGGQLARIIFPARCITLALSDVNGDDLSVIASGPTNPDDSSYGEAISIIEKYSIKDQVPDSIIKHLHQGSEGVIAETPKSDEPAFKKVANIVIGSNRLALKSAELKAQELGYNSMIFTSMVDGEAREIAKLLAAIIKEVQVSNLPVKKPACLLFGGEPTVHLTGNGLGGRNQELALAVAVSGIKHPYLFVSCGSDGTDGPTDAAGAIVSQDTLNEARKKNLNYMEYLRNNDAYNFFSPLGHLIKTGPTGTNVMDIIFALIP